VRVKVAAEKATGPARMDGFRITVEVPGLEGEQHLEGVRRSVEKCLVKNTMLHAPSIAVEISTLVSA